MTLSTLADWLSHLETQHVKAIDMGLERVQKVAHVLALQQLGCPVITVAGTNGKGSTVATLTAIYTAAGYRVGTYTSPHITYFNERIALQNQPVNDELLISAFEHIEAARTTVNISLTYFEFTTLAALWIFQQSQLDIVVLEVGLGGRLDAVNIIDADVAVVTSIGIDHVDWLGDTREKISVEKAGIFRTHKPAIYGEANPPQPLLDYAAQLATPLQIKHQQFGFSDDGETWSWWNETQTFTHLPKAKLALDNVATAIAAIRVLPLNVTEVALHNGLKSAQLAGRAEHLVYQQKKIVMDVAHNAHGAAFFMQQLPVIPYKTFAVFAMLSDKDIGATLDSCLGRIDAWFIAGLDVPRGTPVDKLAPLLLTRGMVVGGSYQTVGAAMRAALAQAQTGDRILVFGSFYTVAAAKQWLATH